MLSDDATLSIDLPKPWTNATVVFNTINKNAQGATPWNLPYLWLDSANSSFFQWGGQWSNLRLSLDTAPSVLYQFTPDGGGGGIWVPQATSAGSPFPALCRGVGGAASTKGDTWYEVGGYTTRHSDLGTNCPAATTLGSFITYNSTSAVWTSDSAAGLSPSGSLVWSHMHSVPFGRPGGLNIILGGGIAAWGSDPVQPALIGLDHIYVYNPVIKVILNQSASESTFGSTPQPRKQFCSVGLALQDLMGPTRYLSLAAEIHPYLPKSN